MEHRGPLYTLEVQASRDAPGSFTWLIRERGKLRRGSYKPHPSSAQARAVAESEMRRLIARDMQSGRQPLQPSGITGNEQQHASPSLHETGPSVVRSRDGGGSSTGDPNVAAVQDGIGDKRTS